MGKVPIGVANLAKKYHKPVVAFGGECDKRSRKRQYLWDTDAYLSDCQRMHYTGKSDGKRDCKREFGIDRRAGHQIVESSSKR